MSKIYLDTCIVIYLIEKHPVFSAKIEPLIGGPNLGSLFYSPLTKMECMVMPLRTKDQPLKELYEDFFAAQTALQIPDAVFEKAAQLRADFTALRTPDALHLAAALHHNCDEFWTNDTRLHAIGPSVVRNVL